jgi:type II secretory pathway component PulF
MRIDMRDFLLAAASLLFLLISLAVYSSIRTRKVSRATWDQLLNRLIITDRANLVRVALDAVDENGDPRRDGHAKELEIDQIWDLVGGLKGLEVLEHNSRVLVEIAAYLQRWYPEAIDTAEELRHSAREIEWHVNSLRAGADSGNLEGWFARYAQNAVATYYSMTRRLLTLCQNGDFQMLGDLQKAL